MIISKTPYRISFFGGGTDYPVWYRDRQGSILGTTIDKFCYITCRYLPPFFSHKHRIVYSRIEMVRSVEKIKHPAVRSAMEFMDIREGLEIHHDGDLPARTGLGTSSSFMVGLLNSLYALKGVMPTKARLAREAIHIERDVLKENVGSQDQVLASFGGFNRIDFRGDDLFQVTPVIVSREMTESLERHMMLYFTGFARYASDIAGEQIANTRSKKAELTQMCGMVDEGLKIITEGNDILDFGRLLNEAWKLKRSLSSKISNSGIDEIYSAAMKEGALGGKLLGAGGGGFMLFFAGPEAQARIEKKLKKFLRVKFSFQPVGSQIIFYAEDIAMK